MFQARTRRLVTLQAALHQLQRVASAFTSHHWIGTTQGIDGLGERDVAERAGHSVDVLLRVYAKCIDGQQEIANKRIGEALAA
ncbi:hypothetical protein [Nonomuraea aurantiaca]|uniref:hypothetical protein n=1 Tax=Nonomuraea aurantiaca TaxID=2878562 RepID=UPI001CDA2DDB|nr:hypothetical protein [Nonomuraea aurantiaca]MCA2229651.1 hypothetical protein [Nonomuraea aurantiaca]